MIASESAKSTAELADAGREFYRRGWVLGTSGNFSMLTSRDPMRVAITVRVPRGTHDWFNLCGDRTVRAIRLFQDVSGWTHYTDSGIDAGYDPVCFGKNYLPRNR